MGRVTVPTQLSRNLQLYYADLWIHRDRLRSTWNSDRAIVCAVTGTESGEIVHLPPDDEAAARIYTSLSSS